MGDILLHFKQQNFYEDWNKLGLISHQYLLIQFSQNFSSFYPLITVTLIILSILLSKYVINQNRKRELLEFFFQHSKLNNRITERIKTFVGSYSPPWWYSPHLGTIFPFGHDPQVQYVEEIFVDNGSKFSVHWYPCKPSTNEKKEIKIILFLPGIGLTSRDKFCQQFVLTVEKKDFYTVVVNPRGVNVMMPPFKQAKLWHPGIDKDALKVLNSIEELYPVSKLFLVGYSAGSNIVQKILSKQKQNNNSSILKAGFCVCSLQDYEFSRTCLESNVIGRLYSFILAYVSKKVLFQQIHSIDKSDKKSSEWIQTLNQTTSLSQYDKIVYSNCYNYQTEKEYLQTLSMTQYELSLINKPLLIMQPLDDPLHQPIMKNNQISLKCLNINYYIDNHNIIYYQPKYGNHFGFYQDSLLNAFSNKTSYTYPAKVCTEYFNEILESNDEIF